MAIAATTVFEVRTTGSDTNGGGYVTGSTGIDYSQQDASQFSGTDLVIDAATNTKVTSATHNFVANDVGNLIQISAGTGFTTGFFQIISVASNAATLDRSAGTLASTGGTWALGGALASPGKASNAMASGNNLWIKSGTYSISSSTLGAVGSRIVIPLGLAGTRASKLQGYQTTRGDSGTMPILNNAGGWTGAVVDVTAANIRTEGIEVRVNSAASVSGIRASNNNAVYRCRSSGTVTSGFDCFEGNGEFIGCWGKVGAAAVSACRAFGGGGGATPGNVYFCVGEHTAVGNRAIDMNGGHVIGTCVLNGNIVYRTGGSNVHVGNSIHNGRYEITGNQAAWVGVFINNVVGNLSSGSAFDFTGATPVSQCVMMQNATYALTGSAIPYTSGHGVDGTFIDLGASSPFVDATNSDFRLASNAAALLLKQTGWQTYLTSASSFLGYPDIGAAQAQAGSVIVIEDD